MLHSDWGSGLQVPYICDLNAVPSTSAQPEMQRDYAMAWKEYYIVAHEQLFRPTAKNARNLLQNLLQKPSVKPSAQPSARNLLDDEGWTGPKIKTFCVPSGNLPPTKCRLNPLPKTSRETIRENFLQKLPRQPFAKPFTHSNCVLGSHFKTNLPRNFL